MRIEDCLTVLIPLKGRDRETFRLLKYLNSVECPFKVLIADGDRDISDQIDLDYYPNLNMEYFFNGHDTTINDFMNKMDVSFSKITTPLTIMLDNDDFISIQGMVDGIKFLADREEYSSYRESITEAGHSTDIYMRTPVVDNDVFDRIQTSLTYRSAGWHDITRTYIHKKLFSILNQCKTDDLQLVFSLVTYWYTLYGKSFKGTTKPYYYHVTGNSLVQGKGIYSRYVQWVGDPRIETSIPISISAVANCVSQSVPDDLNDIKRRYAEMLLTDIYTNNNVQALPTSTVDKYVQQSECYDEQCSKILAGEDLNKNYELDIHEFNCISPVKETAIFKALI